MYGYFSKLKAATDINAWAKETTETMNAEEKDAIYRYLWREHVEKDVRSQLDQNPRLEHLSDEEYENLIKSVATRYVYDCRYDCNLSYWDNIDNLISEELTKSTQPTPVENMVNTPKLAGITLLSLEEYQELKPNISLLNRLWWLRSPGYDGYRAAFVDGEYGFVSAYGDFVDDNGGNVRRAFCVRPALVLESSTLQIGDNFEFGNHIFTVISEKYALCNDSIGDHCFREDWKAKDANDYKKSDVKIYIESWAKEHGLDLSAEAEKEDPDIGEELE